MDFTEALEKAGAIEPVIDRIVNADYARDANQKQDNANFYAAAMRECEELLGFDKTAEAMFHRACSKSGFRLDNAKRFAKEHAGKPLEEKLERLGRLQYMGKPRLSGDGCITTDAVGSYGSTGMACPCWHLSGCRPAGGPMPLSYCLCCAGHFQFHYQKALGLKLRVKEVVSSILNSEGRQPCVFVYEILD